MTELLLISFIWIFLGCLGFINWRAKAYIKRIKLDFFQWLLLSIFMTLAGPMGFLISFIDIENYLDKNQKENMESKLIDPIINALKFPLVYDKEGQTIIDQDGRTVLNMRGWGWIAKLGNNADKMQDAWAEEIIILINNKHAKT